VLSTWLGHLCLLEKPDPFFDRWAGKPIPFSETRLPNDAALKARNENANPSRGPNLSPTEAAV
jgi:hypothetical protein